MEIKQSRYDWLETQIEWEKLTTLNANDVSLIIFI